ncbi:hypothetical protein KJ765_04090 [Candidatus Micrarchaeota archaeon]|nr:hypothetical protein [Candidatus Micrarchaeota archaeon]
MFRKRFSMVMALALLSTGCLISLEGTQLESDKTSYTTSENVLLSAKGDGSKYAWQGSNITEIRYYNAPYNKWMVLDLGEIPNPYQVCLPSGTLVERFEMYTPENENSCKRLLNAEFSWNGLQLMKQELDCNGQPYTHYQKFAKKGKFKAVLKTYNDAGCSSLNQTLEVEFEVQ